jgi:hypothetical protein
MINGRGDSGYRAGLDGDADADDAGQRAPLSAHALGRHFGAVGPQCRFRRCCRAARGPGRVIGTPLVRHVPRRRRGAAQYGATSDGARALLDDAGPLRRTEDSTRILQALDDEDPDDGAGGALVPA